MQPNRQRSADRDADDPAGLLLDTLTELAGEISQSPLPADGITLDSSLAGDLGFDSLARVEMTLRIEQVFAVHLPASTLAAAASPRDLLREILRAKRPTVAGNGSQSRVDVQIRRYRNAPESPRQAQTLQELLNWHLHAHPDQEHIYLYGESERIEQVLTFRSLHDGARRVADALLAKGMEPGQTVAIMLPTGSNYFHTFFGILLARGVPVPLYPPARLSQLEDHLLRHARILDNAQAVFLLTFEPALQLSRLLEPLVPSLRGIIDVDALPTEDRVIAVGTASADDLAFLQYTSGSTGNPKGVMLSHANLLANLRAMGSAVGVSADDVFVSWLPLYHDMGLIGAWLGSLYYSLPLVSIPTQLFLARPSLWLQAISAHRGTISAAPNFAYELCLKMRDEQFDGLDLSSWRLALNGAEPVNPRMIRRFSERFARFGFRPESMKPVYGLAESSVGVAFPPPGRAPLIDRVRRDALVRDGEARPADAGDDSAMEIVSAGQPMPGHQVRIVDDQGRELPEREVGRLQFRGPSTTSGYYRNPEQTRELFSGEWANSGDLAYIAGGDIFITGRSKDVIIRAGRNIYPQELEAAVGEIDGIRKGCVVVFGLKPERDTVEQLIVVAETRETEPRRRARLTEQIREVALTVLGAQADDILLAPPGAIPKTSSGKLRRNASADLYQRGFLRQRTRAVWWQVARLALAGVRPRIRRSLRTLRDGAYAGWCWLCTTLLAPLVWGGMAILPRRDWNWRFMQYSARLLLWLTGTRVRLQGVEQLPGGACVLVANHASYLDGLVLLAALPTRYRFVAKAELAGNIFTRLFLQRLDCAFVERFDTDQSVADAGELVTSAQAGCSLCFFPEGTFRRMPGIAPFHLGAFVCAQEAGCPVVPVTLRGTRAKLRDTSLFPRRGDVDVHIGKPLQGSNSGWSGAVELRNAARAEILRHAGEPDLGSESLHR